MAEVLDTHQYVYQLSQKLLLTFDTFYQSMKNDKDNIKLEQICNLQFKECLSIEIQEVLKIFILKKHDQKWTQKQLVLENPIASQLFDMISFKLNQNQQNSEKSAFYEDLLQQANQNIPDLLVKDIYGPDSSSIGLPENMLAASLGKLSKENINQFDKKQILRSLLMTLAINAAQLSGLLGLKYNIKSILVNKNKFGSIPFYRYMSSLLKLYNQDARLFVRIDQNQKNKI